MKMCPLCTNAVHSTTIKLPYKHEVEGSKPSHDGIFMVAQGKSAYKQRCVFFCAVVCLLRVARTSCRTDLSHGLRGGPFLNSRRSCPFFMPPSCIDQNRFVLYDGNTTTSRGQEARYLEAREGEGIADGHRQAAVSDRRLL